MSAGFAASGVEAVHNLPLPVWLTLGLLAAGAAWLRQRARERPSRDSQLLVAVREAPPAALRTHMDPHFLFNTMNAICGYAVRRDYDAVIGMLTRLSDLLRAGYRQDGATVVALPDEVRLLQSYLELQQLRHGAAADVDVALDDSAKTALVSPLVLHALVEADMAASAASFTAGVVGVRVSCVGEVVEVEVVGNDSCSDPPGTRSRPVATAEGPGGSMLRLRIRRMNVIEPTLERAQ